MRLSKIKLAGFKSFVDPTTVYLNTNLVGVVGPNGSGKSNIIDAVRWVMGESSAKHLRGESMADVIFNGSSGRKPVGQASIELVFDNTVGNQLGGQFASYNEICIKRQVTRDGQSNYYLNSARCRRRDITDIFLGTGLGPRSYAIIEQGMISRLIEAKPEDLRNQLEEAAGISKYKERRRETENRMRHTHENLTRINDLREELDKQLEKLQRQAKTAEKYKTYKHEERELKGELLALQWRNIDVDAREKEQAVMQFETELEGKIASQRSHEAGIEKQREEHIVATDEFNEVQATFYQIGSDIAAREQTIQHMKSRRNELENDLHQIDSDYQQAFAHQSTDQTRLTELREKVAELEPSLEEALQKAEVSGLQFEEIEQQLSDWQSEWDEFTHKAGEPSQLAEVERTRITHMEDQSRQFEQRHQRLQEELRTLDSQQLDHEVAALQITITELQLVVEELSENRHVTQAQITETRQKNHEVTTQLADKRNAVQKVAGRISSLEALQEAALGKNDSQLAQWLSERRLAQAPRLAEGLDVTAGWEKAIETVLGFHLEAVCVDDLDDVVAHLGELQDESVEFICRDEIKSVASDISLTLLADCISTQWPLQSMLAGIYCADNINQAMQVRHQLASHESVVTKDGIWIGANWLRINQGQDDLAGVLAREKDLKALQAEHVLLSQEIESLEEDLETAKEQLQEYEQTRDEIQTQVSAEERRLGEIKSQFSAKQARIEQINNRHKRIQTDLAELKEQIHSNQQITEESRGRLEGALEEMQSVEELRATLLSRRDEIRNAVNECRMSSSDDAKQAQSLQLELQSSQSALAVTEQNLLRVNAQLESLQDRKEHLSESLNEDDNPLETLAEELEASLARRVEVENLLKEARRKVESIDAEMRSLTSKKTQVEQGVQGVRDGLDNARMDAQTLRVRRQTIQEQLVESGYELQAIFEGLPDVCRIEEWEQNLAQLAQRIQRLGAINLAAIDEYKEQSERKEHLDSQYNDLIEALETLEEAIHKIDKETRARFKETFDQVNTGLKEMFPKLFGGGQAHLELTGEDMLDTGVSILARPPGKRITNIHLLSGGEKALTAVALVFAIFKLNPAPFCMLDEVDAPLDEANVGRFSQLVKEMSSEVQFIFISHNKTTMEIADNLNGVTMHEPGVSRMVSVDVEEAAVLAAM